MTQKLYRKLLNRICEARAFDKIDNHEFVNLLDLLTRARTAADELSSALGALRRPDDNAIRRVR